jgi:hypothetical protein
VTPAVAGMALVLGEGNVYVNQGEKVDEGSLSQGVDIGQSLTNSGNGLAGRNQEASLLTHYAIDGTIWRGNRRAAYQLNKTITVTARYADGYPSVVSVERRKSEGQH